MHEHLLGDEGYGRIGGETAADNKQLTTMEALRLPGVAAYCATYALLKLVSYTQMFWLPYYLEPLYDSDSNKADRVASLNDIGMLVGAIIAGGVSDRWLSRAATCAVLQNVLPLPLMLLKRQKNAGPTVAWLVAACGFAIGGPAQIVSGTAA